MSVTWEPRLKKPCNFKAVLLQSPPAPQVKVDSVPEQPTEIPKAEDLAKSDPIDIPGAGGPGSDMSDESSDEEEQKEEEVPKEEEEEVKKEEEEVPKAEEEDTVVVDGIVNNTGLPIELSGLQVAECSGWKYIPYLL